MELTNIQLEQVDAQIKRLLNTDSYYGNIYSKYYSKFKNH